MQIVVNKLDREVVLRVDGRIDAVSSPQFRQEIITLIDAGHTRLIIDCALLAYISSAGLRVLYEVLSKLEQNKGKIALCRPNEDVRRIFDMVDMSSEIPIFATQEQAIESLA
jgi:anti-anti-sigma factor